MLRYKTKSGPGLVALYDIRPGNGAGPFLQPRSPHGALTEGTGREGVRVWCSKVAASRFQVIVCRTLLR